MLVVVVVTVVSDNFFELLVVLTIWLRCRVFAVVLFVGYVSVHHVAANTCHGKGAETS